MRVFSCDRHSGVLGQPGGTSDPSMVRSYAIILPELIHGSIEYKFPLVLLSD